mgnify:CR=1 FL=1
MTPVSRRAVLVTLASTAALTSFTASAQGAGKTLLNVSYDVSREFYKDVNAAFVANYKKTTGKDIKIDQSHAGSSAQARAVAARLAGYAPVGYDPVPWFWSDQGPLKLQMAGLAAGRDTAVVRGDPASGAFSVFCFAKDRLLAVESVNMPGDHMAGPSCSSSPFCAAICTRPKSISFSCGTPFPSMTSRIFPGLMSPCTDSPWP